MTATITAAPVRKSIVVKAPPERAFAVFAAGIGTWWPATHSVGSSPMKQAVIEPHEGGRWYERGEDGSECQWGKVLAWEPPRRLLLAWQLDARFKYDPDLVTEVEVRFTALGTEGTRVDLEHRKLEAFAGDAEKVRGQVDAPGGWTLVLDRFAQAIAQS
ncbi:MAG TPA: SRPBCC family protein [Stellaceae bacterium]|nr:SRPBCC family protein [Stellaceae bacterium]